MAEHPDDDAYWVGYLSHTIANALKFKPLEASRLVLERALHEFKASPASAGLFGRQLRPRKVLDPLPDDYDLNDDWKPCGNPECRAPLPRRSKKLYCDKTCKSIAAEIAGEYDAERAEEEFRKKNPDYDEIPF